MLLMKRHYIILLIAFTFCTNISVFGQINILQLQIDSLKYLRQNTFDCNSVTWRIIANKNYAIQPLIDRLDDTTMTAAKDKCKKTNFRVGDLAYLTLTKILPIPFYTITGLQNNVTKDECQGKVFEYIEMNREKFKAQVQAYYNKKSDKLKWVPIHSNHLTPCQRKNNVKGRYE